MSVLFGLLLGCTNETTDTDQFANDSSIRIIEPNNGDILETEFVLKYEVGADIETLKLELNNEAHSNLDITEKATALTLNAGSHKLSLIGFGEDSTWLSETSITITVDVGDPWVTITSPSDGSIVSNPVNFNVTASDDIDEIEFFADDWSLGTTTPEEILTYTFAGTSFSREIKAVGYASGSVVAEHNISIVVNEASAPLSSEFNQHVLAIIPTYPTDGSYGYYWPSGSDWLGTTEDIYYQGELIAEGDPNEQSYCVGLTFEVFMKAWAEVDQNYNSDGTINAMDIDDLYEFRVDWYVRELYGAGPSDAAENYGIGEVVTNWDHVNSGDFLQWWRHSGSGHNAIFIDWELDDNGNRIGFQYWSTQNSTDGIGYREEYFGTSGSSVNAQFFFPARIYTPENWYPW